MKTSGRKLSMIAATVALIGQSVGAVMFSNSANAADMLGNPEAEYTNVEFGTGWYIRGDIGGSFQEASTTPSFTGTDLELGSPVSFTIGAGRSFAEGIRGEIVFNHFDGMSFAERTDLPTCPGGITGDCTSFASADITASSVMANAYYDLGKIGGFTPYVGVGGGAAYMSASNFNWSTDCVSDVAGECGVATLGATTIDSGTYTTQNSFALAANAMVGVSYNITKEMSLDLGYRYTYWSEANLVSQGSNPTLADDLSFDGTQIHEIRVGLRYEIW